MRLQAAIQGDLNALLQAELGAAERAVTVGIRAATDGLKTELRGQITGAGPARGWPTPGGARTTRRAARASAPPATSGRRRRAWCGCMRKAGSSARSRACSSPSLRPSLADSAMDGRRSRLALGSESMACGCGSSIARGSPGLLVADNARLTKRGRAAANIGRRQGAAFTRLGANHRAGVCPGAAGDGAQAP